MRLNETTVSAFTEVRTTLEAAFAGDTNTLRSRSFEDLSATFFELTRTESYRDDEEAFEYGVVTLLEELETREQFNEELFGY